MNNIINFVHIAKNAGTSMEEFCNKNKNIRYHGHDAQISILENQMIIIRDPYSRFCSAVIYALENYSHYEKIKKIINAGFITPNHWAQEWKRGNPLIIDEIINEQHTIDSVKTPLKYTYLPQYYWINEKKLVYVIEFDEINSIFRKNIPFKNVCSKHYDLELSNDSKKFLSKIYKKDFEFIAKFKKNYNNNLQEILHLL